MVDASFFDIFGFLGFIYIFIVTVWMLKSDKRLPKMWLIVLLIIAILGMVVNGLIVLYSYII